MRSLWIAVGIIIGLHVVADGIAALSGWNNDAIYGALTSGAIGILVLEMRTAKARVELLESRIREVLGIWDRETRTSWN